MAVTTNEGNGGTLLQRGFTEWWTEETEYVFQRIERWAAFARGYNRLRSQRLSRARLTMSEQELEPRWSIDNNKLVIEDQSWIPHFQGTQHRRKSRPEETKINCCPSFDYQSNKHLDTTCLESYRYDHSIYFKTIGEIRGTGAKDLQGNRCCEESSPESDHEEIEWEAISFRGSKGELDNTDDTITGQKPKDSPDSDDFQETRSSRVDSEEFLPIQPSVDLTPYNNKYRSDLEKDFYNKNMTGELVNEELENNNNDVDYGFKELTVKMVSNLPSNTNPTSTKDQDGIKRFLSFRKTRSMRTVRQPTIVGDNDVVWPSVLLNCTKNIDPNTSPHHRATNKIKCID